MIENQIQVPDAPGPWRSARVVAIHDETVRAKSFRLRFDGPFHFRAGQHLIVRLSAPDGYTASRSYSMSTAPDNSDETEITVERLSSGEVSEFLHDELALGDELEVRGPIGGWFVWEGQSRANLIGGGSGIVPLMSMLRLARRIRRSELVRLVMSVRTPDDLYYASELPGPESMVIFTRSRPEGNPRPAGRLSRADLDGFVFPDATTYICGSSSFADAASVAAMEIGVGTDQIRIERFGATG